MSEPLARATSIDERRFSKIKQLLDVAAGTSPRRTRSTTPDTLADRVRRASPSRARSKSPRRGQTYTLVIYCPTSAMLSMVTPVRRFLIPNSVLDEIKCGILAQAHHAPKLFDEMQDDASMRGLVADAIYLLDSQSISQHNYLTKKISGEKCGALEEYLVGFDVTEFDETPVTRVYHITHPV